jgi:nitrate/nitrite-specific signal transduction histidine kinase
MVVNVDPVRLVDFRLLDKDSTIYISDNKRLLPFSYNQNDIRFDFQLLNYDDPLNIKYAFMLDGLDNHWNFIGKSHSASYTHIPKGNYTLLVKAANSDGVWTQPFQLAHFSISPPFWQTWWFYTLCILSLAAILYGLYRIRINKILAVQRIRNLISRDLHDDVGSTLTGIIMMSEIGENSAQAKTGEAESWLRRIGNNSREMMDNMRDIVWSVNPSKDVMAEVVARMKQYAAQLLEPIDTAYSFDIDQRVFTLHLDFIYKRNVYLIFKEALANASKYANCTEVRIQLSVKENNLKMMVRDNGKGFNVSEVALGNGLRNMHQRALQIKGKLVIESSAEKGTGVALTVPLTRIRYFLPKRFR